MKFRCVLYTCHHYHHHHHNNHHKRNCIYWYSLAHSSVGVLCCVKVYIKMGNNHIKLKTVEKLLWSEEKKTQNYVHKENKNKKKLLRFGLVNAKGTTFPHMVGWFNIKFLLLLIVHNTVHIFIYYDDYINTRNTHFLSSTIIQPSIHLSIHSFIHTFSYLYCLYATELITIYVWKTILYLYIFRPFFILLNLYCNLNFLQWHRYIQIQIRALALLQQSHAN